MEIGALHKEWAETGFSDEKLAELKQRYPDADWLNLAGKVMETSANLQPKFERDVDSLWDRIERRVDGVEEPEEEVEEEAPVRPLKRNRSRIYGIAATLFLLAIVLIALNIGGGNNLTECITGIAKTEVIDLSDGSRVHLASSSTLRWNEETWGENRHLDLEGEAFFEVEPGERFTVGTGKGRVTVLGTSFNVRVRDRILDVTCKTGRVEVTYPNVKEVLNPGEAIRIGANSKATRTTIDPKDIGSWQEGIFYYRGETMGRVFEEIQRQFKVQINVVGQSIESIPCNGYFTNEDLEGAMKQLCIPLGLTYEIDKDKKMVTVRP